jgi:hypothetical protein
MHVDITQQRAEDALLRSTFLKVPNEFPQVNVSPLQSGLNLCLSLLAADTLP